MRGLQGDLEEFRQRISKFRPRPHPPNKTKSTFFEGPPRPPGSARARFIKANWYSSCKTLRFMAKATPGTQTHANKGSFFIIRFYAEDDSLSVYTRQAVSPLGRNSGGVDQGVYMARTAGLVNHATGHTFHPTGFMVGSVVQLPSVSLEITDVDQFTRRFLMQTGHESWQTGPAWEKLAQALTAANCSTPTNKSQCPAPSAGSVHPSSPPTPYPDPDPATTTRSLSAGEAPEASPPSGEVALKRLLSGCIVNEERFRKKAQESSGGGASSGGGESNARGSSPPDEASDDQGRRTVWEGMESALGMCGVNTNIVLNAHERLLLARELEDRRAEAWPTYIVGDEGDGPCRGEGNARDDVAAAFTAGGGGSPGEGGGRDAEREITTPRGKTVFAEVPTDVHEVRLTGREDNILQAALNKLNAAVFNRCGEDNLRESLMAEGKAVKDPVDLSSLTRVCLRAAGLSCRESEVLWRKFLSSARDVAGDIGRVTFSLFLDAVRRFHTRLLRGEVLGLSTI
ncbi:unnamed protein product, partial [Discosporangium mesarthrocarpum]